MDAIHKLRPNAGVPLIVPDDKDGLALVGAAIDERRSQISLECTVAFQLRRLQNAHICVLQACITHTVLLFYSEEPHLADLCTEQCALGYMVYMSVSCCRDIGTAHAAAAAAPFCCAQGKQAQVQ